MTRSIQNTNAFLLFIGSMLVSTGYGATFVLDRHFKSFGGNEIDAGTILTAAMFGTFVGVPLVGWFSRKVGSANFAAIGAVLLAIGFGALAQSTEVTSASVLGGFFVGTGWGVFYLAAPMALSQRVPSKSRGYWFTRFAAFQMAGIGFSPYFAGLVLDRLNRPTSEFFLGISICCLTAFVLLAFFERREPLITTTRESMPWVRALPRILIGEAKYPILMVALGACVFSGIMTFQSSLLVNTDLVPGTFFLTYAVTVVLARWLLAAKITAYPSSVMVPVLLITMVAGTILVFAYQWGLLFQISAAAFLGIGYGLVYPLIQAQAVNSVQDAMGQDAALTCFVLSYFVGIFGFPLIGALMIVEFGTGIFLIILVGLGCAEIVCSYLQNRNKRALLN